MHRFKNLLVWQKAMDLTQAVYEITKSFPSGEQYGLKAQLRRCAVSIPSNIAEGAGRSSDQDFKRFLSISNGSINELEAQLILANRLDYLNEQELNELLDILTEVQKMNFALSERLANKKAKP